MPDLESKDRGTRNSSLHRAEAGREQSLLLSGEQISSYSFSSSGNKASCPLHLISLPNIPRCLKAPKVTAGDWRPGSSRYKEPHCQDTFSWGTGACSFYTGAPLSYTFPDRSCTPFCLKEMKIMSGEEGTT